VLSFYKNNLSHALKRLYPDLLFDRTKFKVLDVYKDTKKRLEFFEEFAKENQFDPLIMENWYSRTKSDIFSYKVSIYLLLLVYLCKNNIHLGWSISSTILRK